MSDRGSARPQLHWRNIAVLGFVGVFPVLLGTFWLWHYVLPIWPGQYLIGAALFCGICVASGLRIVRRLCRDITLTFGPQSASYFTLLGRRHIAWNEVKDFSCVGKEMCGIYSDRGSIIIRLYLYADPDAILERLAERLGPANMPRQAINADSRVYQ